MKPILSLLALSVLSFAQNDPESPTSNNAEIQVLPAPGEVVIDGKDNDWDLSAGIWSYNDPTLVGKHSLWTHLMWDAKGIYVLGRYSDPSPMKNATRGKDFMLSWKADAMQARIILDDRTPEEHQMHINLFHSSSENSSYMIVKHGGFKAKPPYDATGPDRPDQQEKYGTTMEKAGGKIAFSPWDDGRGYNMEAFWPWSYVRTNGTSLKAGDSFVFGLEAMWGNEDGSEMTHRLADNLKDDKVNRIFFFRARDGWGRAVISSKGNLEVTAGQKALQAQRLKQFVNYDTAGPVDIRYTLPDDRDVTIAIDNAQGRRVRNLFGQYPRTKGENTDRWDGMDDQGNPVSAGEYHARIVDHLPVQLEFVNSAYNASTPPWATKDGRKYWGSNHGHPTTAATRGDVTLIGFTGTEGGSGLIRIQPDGIIRWADQYELIDVTLDDQYVYALSRDSWIKQTVMRRYKVADGVIQTFEDEAKSPNAILPVENTKVPDASTIAISKGKVYAFIPGDLFYRMTPATGAVEFSGGTPGLLAIENHDDKLFGLFNDGTIAELDSEGRATRTVITAEGLRKPVRFAFSQDGMNIAVSDQETHQVFILFSKTGSAHQVFGKPHATGDGKRPAGKFIDTDLINPLGLAFDQQGRLWLAEAAGTCRRITCWKQDGSLDKQFWGGADYGAMAGFPLTYDSSRFIAHGVEFQLDPQPDVFNRPTAEKPLYFHPELSETRGLVYRHNGHEYAVSVPGYNKPEEMIVAKRDAEGVFRTVVRVVYPKSGKNPTPGGTWVDRNDNGTVDADETTTGFSSRAHYWSNGWMRPDLTFITPDQQVFRPEKFTPGGVPLYDFTKPEKLPNHFAPDYRSNRSGTVALDMAGNVSDGINYATTDGRTGSYPNPFGRHDAPAARRGLLIAPFRTNGVVEGVPGVGAVTAIGGDRGEWFLMTMDGLFLSSILQDSKGDVTLDETYVGQESFGGFMWRDEKGRILAQLGGASYRIMEIKGLDSTRKQTVPVTLTDSQIAEGLKLAQSRLAASGKEPESLTVAKISRNPSQPVEPDTNRKTPLVDGVETLRVQESGDPLRWFRAALSHDGKNLAVMYQVSDTSPWKNGEGRFTHAFIGGDAVDLQLDVPGRGPIRILGATVSGKDTVAYWQRKADKPENPTTYVVSNNEANAQQFDVVKRLPDAKLSVKPGMRGYSALMTIPLSDLGIDPTQAADLKGIIGVIFSDPSGTNRAARLYWHSKSTGLVSDVPSESKLTPSQWGPVRLQN
ncbi:hypothetical protein OVA24_19955 [Luteolibacter sp. SL250]|uniref:FlgD immunoglobulin-like domain containing protein n=1 Tax=Luteolibacter sp. SL250 TaxID=2995170 RepID=UPI00226EF62B|nr:FlgD immunoglobulin-like domain containing protein [Luteolibacter sp. SL250]WAC19503.1 hypothetical protein OVA24_19955 [Luteolibacter sp. SL250]